MLVLTRKQDQEVSLPDLGVTVKVLQVKGNKVRLGFKAPEDVHVLRGELSENKLGFATQIAPSFQAEPPYAGQET